MDEFDFLSEEEMRCQIPKKLLQIPPVDPQYEEFRCQETVFRLYESERILFVKESTPFEISAVPENVMTDLVFSYGARIGNPQVPFLKYRYDQDDDLTVMDIGVPRGKKRKGIGTAMLLWLIDHYSVKKVCISNPLDESTPWWNNKIVPVISSQYRGKVKACRVPDFEDFS